MWRKRCQLCLRHGELALCASCWNQIAPLTEPSFLLQGPTHVGPCPHIAYAAYASPLKQMLYTIKYHGARDLAFGLGVYLGRWYAERWPAPDLLVPIPLHANRRAGRGYNQAEELAKGLAEVLARPCRPLLTRELDTPALYALSPAERQAALQQAFVLGPTPKRLLGKRILLVDDIVTTGSTLILASQALRPLSERIVSLSLARALLSDSPPAASV